MKIQLLLASLVLLSCQKPISPIPEPIVPKTNINLTELKFDCKGGESMIILSATLPWQIEVDSSWVNISPSSGKAGDSLTITFSVPSTDSHKDREAIATLTLTPSDSVVIPSSTKKEITIKQSRITEIVLRPDQVDTDSIYIPNELKNNNFYSSTSEWFYGRSRQSKHFVVFWDKKFDEFGDITPTTIKNSDYQVNLDQMLSNAERYYDFYVDSLEFASPGSGQSCLDRYKILIMLSYSSEWAAYGSGYDDKTGAIWVNSAAARASSTLAHEIGHSFQYIVYNDQLIMGRANNHQSGFRYNVGTKGCAFWEQTAQWQSYQFTPHTAVGDTYRYTYLDNCHRHFLHEDHRYANSFFLFYIQQKRGNAAVGRIWKESVYPEDALEAYIRIFSLTPALFNAEIYEYASKMALYDYAPFSKFSENYIGKYNWDSTQEGDWFTVSSTKAPEATGFNVINLVVPAQGTMVSVDLEGISPEAESGWTIGFAATLSDKTKLYSDPVLISSATNHKGTASYSVPADCTTISLIVAATPSEYQSHGWDDDNTNDLTLPYKIKIINTDLLK